MNDEIMCDIAMHLSPRDAMKLMIYIDERLQDNFGWRKRAEQRIAKLKRRKR